MLADDTYSALEHVQQKEVSCYLIDTIHNKIFLFVGEKSVQLCDQLEQDRVLPIRQLIKVNSLKANFDQLTQFRQEPSPAVIICDASYSKQEIRALKDSFGKHESIPLVLYSDHDAAEYRSKVLSLPLAIGDFLYEDLGITNIKARIIFLSELKKLEASLQADEVDENQLKKHKFAKRAFDIVVATLCIVLVSPVLLLILIAIKLESRGPVLFISQRAGAGYRIFDFYKFRTMRSDADQMRDHLKALNSYYAKDLDPTEKTEPFFFKIKNDPRVTKVGRILRKTSLDELPQLFNVLKGDMSLVGNRPLPLDEGATLTIDHWANRFLAPAGMTGLWQIASNKDSMSVSERIELDLEYVKKSSFSLDMQILLKTIPAMLQKD